MASSFFCMPFIFFHFFLNEILVTLALKVEENWVVKSPLRVLKSIVIQIRLQNIVILPRVRLELPPWFSIE